MYALFSPGSKWNCDPRLHRRLISSSCLIVDHCCRWGWDFQESLSYIMHPSVDWQFVLLNWKAGLVRMGCGDACTTNNLIPHCWFSKLSMWRASRRLIGILITHIRFCACHPDRWGFQRLRRSVSQRRDCLLGADNSYDAAPSVDYTARSDVTVPVTNDNADEKPA